MDRGTRKHRDTDEYEYTGASNTGETEKSDRLDETNVDNDWPTGLDRHDDTRTGLTET